MSEHLQITTEGAARLFVLARAARKNALTLDMYTALAEGLSAAADDPGVRAAVIAGDGDTFCAGNDLQDFLGSPPVDEHSPVFRFLKALHAFPKPLIAAVHGAAIGVGTTMLLHCDLVYAARGARLRMPFTSLALVPEAASSLLLPAAIGHQRASALLLLGDTIDADEAWRLGLVNEVHADADATRARAMARAAELAALPPTSVRLTKQLLKRASAGAVSETLAHEAGFFRDRLASPELAEAVTAFFERRKPDFSRF